MGQVQVFVVVLLAIFAFLISISVACSLFGIRWRVKQLEEKPKPKEKKNLPRRIEVRTRHGISVLMATTVGYPNDGKLIILDNEALVALYAKGVWLAVETLCTTEEKKGEKDPVQQGPSGDGQVGASTQS